MSPPSSLEQQILAALERSLIEGRSEAAEHLLRALEALRGDASPGTPLADAYLAAVEGRASKRSRQ
jgi:hypothetical protein